MSVPFFIRAGKSIQRIYSIIFNEKLVLSLTYKCLSSALGNSSGNQGVDKLLRTVLNILISLSLDTKEIHKTPPPLNFTVCQQGTCV